MPRILIVFLLAVVSIGADAQVPPGAYTIHLKVTNADGVYEDQVDIDLTEIPPASFVPPRVTALDAGGGLFLLEAHTQNAIAWGWQIEDPAYGDRPCPTAPARRCVLVDGSPDHRTVPYQWREPNVPGTYRVVALARGCVGPIALHAIDVDVVTIEPPAPPTVLAFDLGVNPSCVCQLGFCDCPIDEELAFKVDVVGATHVEVDWTGDGVFGPALPISSTLRHTYDELGLQLPAVRARRGTAVSTSYALDRFLLIVP
ncbi:MAG: hypothetical protein AAGN66_30535 [Acidobacteriota bacterium]